MISYANTSFLIGLPIPSRQLADLESFVGLMVAQLKENKRVICTYIVKLLE